MTIHLIINWYYVHLVMEISHSKATGLWYISTFISFFKGEDFQSLAYQFRLGHSTICNIVDDTSKAIYDVLRDEYFKVISITHSYLCKTFVYCKLSGYSCWFTICSCWLIIVVIVIMSCVWGLNGHCRKCILASLLSLFLWGNPFSCILYLFFGWFRNLFSCIVLCYIFEMIFIVKMKLCWWIHVHSYLFGLGLGPGVWVWIQSIMISP